MLEETADVSTPVAEVSTMSCSSLSRETVSKVTTVAVGEDVDKAGAGGRAGCESGITADVDGAGDSIALS